MSVKFRGLFRSHENIYRSANEGRQFDVIYASMLVFGCLIALLGLLLNSPAVIIGAMLISPLMGPLLACGLALSLADWHIGSKAARNIGLSIVETVAIAALASWLSPLKDLTPEIAARTNPNLMDLLIALFSGTAGTLALASRKQAFTILPGVAIATAVMPPLATIGYGLSTRQLGVARGASMLFLTNLTAIILSAALVFTFIGFRTREHLTERPARLVRFRIAIALVVVVALAIPLVQTLDRAAQQATLRRHVREQFERVVGTQLKTSPTNMSVTLRDGTAYVDAMLPTDSYIPAQRIEALQAHIQNALRHRIVLRLQQVQLASAQPAESENKRDYVSGGAIRPASVKPESAATLPNMKDEIQTRLCRILATLDATSCSVTSFESSDSFTRVSADLKAPTPLSCDSFGVATSALSMWLDSPVTLSGTVQLEGSFVEVSYGEPQTHFSAETTNRLKALRPMLSNSGIEVEFSAGLPEANAKVTTARLRSLADILGVERSRITMARVNSNATTVSLIQHLPISCGRNVPRP